MLLSELSEHTYTARRPNDAEVIVADRDGNEWEVDRTELEVVEGKSYFVFYLGGLLE